MIEETNVIINPYRDSIAEILMKEWKEKNKAFIKNQEEKSNVKWTSLSGLRNIGEAKNKGVE